MQNGQGMVVYRMSSPIIPKVTSYEEKRVTHSMDSSMLPTRYTTWSIRRSSTLGHRLSILVRGETLARGDAIFGLYVEPSGEPYMSFDRGDGGRGTPFSVIAEDGEANSILLFNLAIQKHENLRPQNLGSTSCKSFSVSLTTYRYKVSSQLRFLADYKRKAKLL